MKVVNYWARCGVRVCSQVLLFGRRTWWWWWGGGLQSCAWAGFVGLSPVLAVRGASYRVEGEMCRACVRSVLTCGTEACAMGGVCRIEGGGCAG